MCIFLLCLLNQVLEGISTPANEDLFFENLNKKKKAKDKNKHFFIFPTNIAFE